MKSSIKILTGLAFLAILLIEIISTAHADSNPEPAVSAPNLKIGGATGVLDSDFKSIFSASGTIPLSHSYGIQFDGVEMAGEGDNRAGIGLHIFKRDPSSYLLGVTSLWGRRGNEDAFRYGVESEKYIQNLTLRFAGGGQNQEGDTTGYYNASLKYYFADNFAVSLRGFGYSDTRGAGSTLEWKPNWSMPLSIYSSGGDSNNSNGYGLIGLRYSFGDGGATLKERHRKFDPDNIIDTFFNQENGGAKEDPCTPVIVVDGAGPAACGAPGPA